MSDTKAEMAEAPPEHELVARTIYSARKAHMHHVGWTWEEEVESERAVFRAEAAAVLELLAPFVEPPDGLSIAARLRRMVDSVDDLNVLAVGPSTPAVDAYKDGLRTAFTIAARLAHAAAKVSGIDRVLPLPGPEEAGRMIAAAQRIDFAKHKSRFIDGSGGWAGTLLRDAVVRCRELAGNALADLHAAYSQARERAEILTKAASEEDARVRGELARYQQETWRAQGAEQALREAARAALDASAAAAAAMETAGIPAADVPPEVGALIDEAVRAGLALRALAEAARTTPVEGRP